MTKFNPENKSILTYGDALAPAMKITDQADADQYKSDYIAYQERHITNGRSESGMTAEQMVNANLGYFAGYYSDEVRERVERLFKCSHPIFGSIKKNGVPTNKEAYECGKQGRTLDEIRS